MMPARHRGCYACLSPARCRCWRCNLPPPRTGSWRKWSSSAATVFVRRRPATGKPSRPPPADRGPSGPPMTGSSPAMAMPPWSTKGVRKASITASSACCRPDARRRSRYTCAPARCSVRERPPRRWWMAPSPAAASLSIMSAGMPIPCFRPTSSPPRKPTRPPAGGGEEKAGDLAQRRQALAPTIQLLKQAVCQADKPCPIFDTPWQVEQSKSGKTTISGLSVMANMVETLRLGWSENLPLSQLAWARSPRPGRSPPCCRC